MASNFLSEHRQMASRQGEEQGFSLLEIIIVVAVMMVMIVFAFPAVLNSVHTYVYEIAYAIRSYI